MPDEKPREDEAPKLDEHGCPIAEEPTRRSDGEDKRAPMRRLG